ncbi:phage portal protein [Pontibacillus salipaludis]|uniref:Phage portal protein n=1 Tax=Pontibacillus salipaludis TaxID=1697394 RepID=A0ABQ1PXA2_9BACI|nr:phage portal protein [Pontibacillus salipaludis]GGD05359.1 phage portal protein [Pontibacillus salipaludis]
MGLRDILSSLLPGYNEFDLRAVNIDLGTEVHYKRLAINTCINLIASTLVRAHFRTFEKGKEVKKQNHYLFNVQPNQNQNSSAFFHELVSKLVYENECLVVQQDGYLYIADTFNVNPFAFKENIYTDITINEFPMWKTFKESEVFYFRLNNESIESVINSLYADYGKLISSSINHYKRSNAMRAKVKLKGRSSQTNKDQKNREEMFNKQLKDFMTAEGAAVYPYQEGQELEEFNNLSNSGRTSRDIRAIIDDVFDFVSMGFHIPKGLLKGDLADVEGQTDNLIMFCVAPIAELIQDEVNRKYYGEEDYLNRTYLKVDTTLIKYTDPVKIADALDKFLSSGTHSVNDNKRMINEEPIEEEWADEHFVTKNYQEVQEYMEENKTKQKKGRSVSDTK